MATLGKLWAGRVYGTNTGNLFIKLDKNGPEIEGTFRFLDTAFGVSVYKITGSFDGALWLKGEAVQAPDGTEHGIITAEAQLTPNGTLTGQWSSTIGTGGTFDAYPHDQAAADPTAPTPQPPEQVFNRTIVLGSVQLFATDVQSLLECVRQDFLHAQPVVTYNVRGSQATKYEKDFVREMSLLGKLDYLKVQIQEPDAYGINKAVTVELTSWGANEIRVQGIRESWVIGKAETLAVLLRASQTRLVTLIRRYGLNFLFLAMLVAISDITVWYYRALFVVGVVVLLVLYVLLLKHVIPNASIQASPEQPNLWSRLLPSLISWVAAIAATLIGSFLFYWLTRVGPP